MASLKPPADLRSLEAEFVCEKQLAALAEPLRSRGTLRIERAGEEGGEGECRIRFDTTEPYRSDLIVAGGHVLARSQHEKSWTRTRLSDRPGLGMVMGRFAGWALGQTGDVEAQESVRAIDEPVPAADPKDAPLTARLFELTPRDRAMAAVIQSVRLGVDRETHALAFLQITTAQGDVTRYWFTHVRQNPALPADTFDPSDAR